MEDKGLNWPLFLLMIEGEGLGFGRKKGEFEAKLKVGELIFRKWVDSMRLCC